jgi:hypothetical protein
MRLRGAWRRPATGYRRYLQAAQQLAELDPANPTYQADLLYMTERLDRLPDA